MARSPSSPIILPCPAKRVSAFSVVDGSVYRPPYQVRPFARPGHRQLGPLGTNGPYTFESSGISVGLSRCSRCPIWCADATHTQNLAKSDPATTPAPWTVQWHLKALKSARGLRRNRISPRSFPRDTCDNLRPNRPWRSPRVKNQAIELANSSHWRGRCSHVDSVEKSAYAEHLRTNEDPPLPRSDPHLCPKSH